MASMWKLAAIAVIGVCLALGQSRADPDPPPVEKHSGEDPHYRAGHPQTVAWWAVPSNSPCNVGYYVGGGCALKKHADARAADEGTWGWDYQGYLPRRVMLGWWHGRCYQGGIQSYKVNGPRPQPRHVEAHDPH
jgi:hypothetical protein